MKNEADNALAKQRDDLLAQIHIEREYLAQQGASLRLATQVIDKVRNGMQHLKNHPESLLLPLVLTFVTRSRRLWTLGFSSIGLWRMLLSWRRRLLS